MRRINGRIGSVGALFLISLVTACSVRPAGTSTLQGTVTTASGAPAAGLRAAVPASGLSGVTDAAGQFSLEGAEAGPATLELNGPGVKASIGVPRLGDDLVVRLSVHLDTDGGASLESEPEAELSGPIDSIAAPDLVVSGHTIHTDANTAITVAGAAATLADLKPGETVEVEGAQQADGSVLARKVKADVEHAPESEVELHGAIDSIAAPDLTVGGKTVHTDAQTSIEVAGRAAALTDLAAGQQVEVKGALQADGSVLATELKAEAAEAPEQGDADLKGAIAAIAAPDLTVGGKTVHTSASTRIELDGHDATLADLAVGQQVEVKGAVQADGSINASRIDAVSVMPPPPPAPATEVELHGKVEAISGGDLTVAGHLVHTDTLTVVRGHGAHALSDVKLGAAVEVRGSLQADGSTLAARIDLED